MRIYFIKDGYIDHLDFDNVANLEAFERELNESYDVWSYDKEDLEDECDIIEPDPLNTGLSDI